jgi:uncharacterized protein with NAD-binding domain and iron-sulfur cluster
MTAAFELSRPEHAGRYRITVYQMGWRLGGKGASGRGPSGRIEEHGLHIWMGWYENAFGIMRDCYEELARDPQAPLATWRDAFSAFDRIGVVDQISPDEWSHWSAVFPPGDGLPGDPLPAGHRWTAATYMVRGAQLLATLFETVRRQTGDASEVREPGKASQDLLSRMLGYGELATLAGMIHGASVLGALFESASPVAPSVLTTFVDALATSARTLIEARLGNDFAMQRIWQVIDLTIATLRGGLRSGILSDPRGFDAIDDYDCREWLRMNGASEASLQSGYLRALYDLGFSYEGGDPARPSISAGQALRGMMRTFFTYRGAFFWKMHAGMGDVVFAPLYEVLEKRGVRFEFFHLLRNVGLASGEGEAPHVATLELDVQARVRADGYRPLVDVGGLPCWPSEPDFAQLVDGEALRSQRPEFECPSRSPVVERKTLKVGKDFDFVVLGVGLGAVPEVCREIVATNPAWQAMVENVKTVATQAFQVWLTEDMAQLGWDGGPVALSGFVEPFDTWADMTHLIPLETWNGQEPRSLAYFCSVLSDGEAADPESHGLVRENAVQFLENHVRHLWPAACDARQRFRWELLAGGESSKLPTAAAGIGRFGTQFWTANIAPSDRYVLSVPGSAKHRISPLDRTYDNFTIAGDWTACGFNAGCVEAAVMSGRLAAHALSGLPALENIVGFDHP